MTRSVHETNKDHADAWWSDHGDETSRRAAVWSIWERLEAKRRYKRRSELARSQLSPSGQPAELEIVTEPAGPYVHHPLSEDDIRALLPLFPADVRPFVRRIHRRLGLNERDMRGSRTEPDPFTGRYGFEEPSGVWGPRLRGRFRHYKSEIDLFAYVYDEARQPDSVKATLWFRQAKTLAHEVAHAWDLFGRSRRDRWRNDEHSRAEEYVEQTLPTWREAVVQFFETEHPDLARASRAISGGQRLES